MLAVRWLVVARTSLKLLYVALVIASRFQLCGSTGARQVIWAVMMVHLQLASDQVLRALARIVPLAILVGCALNTVHPAKSRLLVPPSLAIQALVRVFHSEQHISATSPQIHSSSCSTGALPLRPLVHIKETVRLRFGDRLSMIAVFAVQFKYTATLSTHLTPRAAFNVHLKRL